VVVVVVSTRDDMRGGRQASDTRWPGGWWRCRSWAPVH